MTFMLVRNQIMEIHSKMVLDFHCYNIIVKSFIFWYFMSRLATHSSSQGCLLWFKTKDISLINLSEKIFAAKTHENFVTIHQFLSDL